MQNEGITGERASILGAQAAEAENQVRSALLALETGGDVDTRKVCASLRDASERLACIRIELAFGE